MRLAGKVALISGAAKGQGEAEARLFVSEGARVVIGDVLQDEGRQLAAALGPGAAFVPLDVRREEDWAAAVAETGRRFGRLDILVNNAGIFHKTPSESASAADYMRIIEINQLGVFLGMKHAVGLMKQTGGSMVNISSIAGLRGAPNYAAYVASKFAVRGMTKVAAIDFAAYNIRVNSVHPGLIDTDMIRAERSPESIRNFTSTQLVDRPGTAQDVASLVLFLASDESAFCTGAEFVCDGGLMTGSR